MLDNVGRVFENRACSRVVVVDATLQRYVEMRVLEIEVGRWFTERYRRKSGISGQSTHQGIPRAVVEVYRVHAGIVRIGQILLGCSPANRVLNCRFRLYANHRFGRQYVRHECPRCAFTDGGTNRIERNYARVCTNFPVISGTECIVRRLKSHALSSASLKPVVDHLFSPCEG